MFWNRNEFHIAIMLSKRMDEFQKQKDLLIMPQSTCQTSKIVSVLTTHWVISQKIFLTFGELSWETANFNNSSNILALRFRVKRSPRKTFPGSNLAGHCAKQSIEHSIHSFKIPRQMSLAFPERCDITWLRFVISQKWIDSWMISLLTQCSTPDISNKMKPSF
jgi:hypothetical protein